MTKKNTTLLLLLVALVFVFMLTRLNNPTERKMRLFNVDSLKIATISIFDAADSLSLHKDGDAWRLTAPVEYKANEHQMKNFFEKVFNAETSKTAISESDAGMKIYQISDSVGTHIRMLDASGKELSHMILGKSASASTPARKYNSKKIYSIDRSVNYLIKPDAERWRDKFITNTDIDLVTRLDVSYKDKNYSLAIADTSWMYDNGFDKVEIALNDPIMNTMISGAAKLMANSFIDNDTEYYIEKMKTPLLDVTAQTFDNQTIHLRAVPYEEDSKKLVVQLNDQQTPLFIIYQSMVNQFDKSPEDFRK
ncbi:MAG: DUF4340 domain-containing protein [Candidatus Cloacimonetes bacterium]|nr:DUF4340 domain-containing protein [Candidatus Cloacimonadota bacterium]